MIQKGMGAILIVVAIIMITLALPSLVTATSTATGSALENESASVKSIYQQLPLIFVVLPLILASVGFVMLLK